MLDYASMRGAGAMLDYASMRRASAVAVFALGAVISYFLWPVAAPVSVVMMKAPGAGGLLISRAAFLANPKLYFALLRTAGAAAAAVAFGA